jgi:hypothetical protein
MRAIKLAGVGLCASVILIGVLVAVQRSQGPTDASLIQLIANPDKYDGKVVRVIGFVRLEFEGNALYLHREDYESSLSKNAIWIDATPEMMKREKFDKKYVLLEGTFDAKQFGHMDLFSGELRQIKRAEVWPFGTDPKKDKGTQK